MCVQVYIVYVQCVYVCPHMCDVCVCAYNLPATFEFNTLYVTLHSTSGMTCAKFQQHKTYIQWKN